MFKTNYLIFFKTFRINGVPACANYELLTNILRQQWKFDGFVVSDCGAVENVYKTHHFANSYQEAATVKKNINPVLLIS